MYDIGRTRINMARTDYSTINGVVRVDGVPPRDTTDDPYACQRWQDAATGEPVYLLVQIAPTVFDPVGRITRRCWSRNGVDWFRYDLQAPKLEERDDKH